MRDTDRAVVRARNLPVVTSTRAALALLLVLALLAASCGGDDDDTSTSATSTSSTATTGATATTGSTSTTDPQTTSSEPTTSTAPTSSTTTTSVVTTSSSSTTTEPSTTSTGRVVLVYFNTGDGTDCGEVTGFERAVDPSIGPARAAFDELVGGPTQEEEDQGAFSFFSGDTAQAVLSVGQTGGVLTVDFEDIRAAISNAGTSCGSLALTSSLNATAFQFPTIDRARYLFAGSCDEFGAFIQTDFCEFARTG